MISYLRGVVTRRNPPELDIEVGGVGYQVLATMSAFDKLPPSDQEVVLHTLLVVREDAQTLYGFADAAERQMFCRLMRISGIGAKTALAILSALPETRLRLHVSRGDVDALVKVPGIGKKTAQRLLLELRDMLGERVLSSEAEDDTPSPIGDAVRALINLGWKPAEAQRMVAAVESDELSTEDLIRQALQASLR